MVVVNPYLAGLLADVGGSIDPAVFAQYGVLGAFTVILLWFTKGAWQREKDRSDRLEADNQRLYTLILERVMPVLESATRAAEESAGVLAAMQREREITLAAEARRAIGGGNT